MAVSTRTNQVLVVGVLGDDYGPDEGGNTPSLTPYMRAAAIILGRMIRCAADKGYTHSEDELLEIETWLAAHSFKLSDKAASNERTGDASITYQGQTGMQLDATFYGQQAQVLDGSGCLASIGKSRKATMDWLGKPPSQQIPYSDRR